MNKFDAGILFFLIKGRYVKDYFSRLYKIEVVLCMSVHTRADQLLSQLLMDSLDTLPSHNRHIGHLHEEV